MDTAIKDINAYVVYVFCIHRLFMNTSESDEDSCNERTALMSTESPSVQPYDGQRDSPRDADATRVSVERSERTHRPSADRLSCIFLSFFFSRLLFFLKEENPKCHKNLSAKKCYCAACVCVCVMTSTVFLLASARQLRLDRLYARSPRYCSGRRGRGTDAEVRGKTRHHALHPCDSLHGGRRGDHQIRQLLH